MKVRSSKWYKKLLISLLSISAIALYGNISPVQSQIFIDNEINTDDLIDSSCIGRRNQEEIDSFIITGNDSLPKTPSLSDDSYYPTGLVQTIPIFNVDGDNRHWKKCEPIIEPTGIYKLSNGELVMSRECSR